MPTIQQTDAGIGFINVGFSVGEDKGKHRNDPSDVLLVQWLLAIIYKQPTKPSGVDLGKVQPDTPKLIARFQRTILKRPKPEGYVNRAIQTDWRIKHSTIYQLNVYAAGGEDNAKLGKLILRLYKEHPIMFPILNPSSSLDAPP